MSRFLRRAASAAAAALSTSHRPRPCSRLFVASPDPSAAGHLGLARARPGLRELNALLAPEGFVLDAAQVLGRAALRLGPFDGLGVSKAEEGEDAEAEARRRLCAPLSDAADGRFDDALRALARVAAERPDDPAPRRVAAAICYVVGRADEGDRWLAKVPENALKRAVTDRSDFQVAVAVVTAFGGAPGAAAGSEGKVVAAAFKMLNLTLWGRVFDGDMSVYMKALISGTLKRVVKRKYKELVLKRTGVRDKDDLDIDSTI